jgi:hypothetical protein
MRERSGARERIRHSPALSLVAATGRSRNARLRPAAERAVPTISPRS